MFRHVEILVRHGFTAAVLQQSAHSRPGWFASGAPIREASSTPLRASDVLVLPEVCHKAIARRDAGYRRVVMAMSWAYIYNGLPAGEDYRTCGITDVIAGCDYIREFIAETMGLPSQVIPAGVDSERFRPASRKTLQIACMPRKNRHYLHSVECAFRSQFPQFRDVPFVRLENMTHDQVASQLANSAVFLSTGFPEGIARPVLEAMASECLVVAFHGRGGLEYMRHGENCYVVADADVLAASMALAEAIVRFQGGGRTMQESGRATALRYSLEREETAVVEYWRRFLAGGRASG